VKRSRTVALTLVASAFLVAGGCSSEEATTREMYASKDKCAEDWGEKECEENQTRSGYYGPHYFYRSGTTYYVPRGSDEPVPVRHDQGFSRVAQGARSTNSVTSVSSTRTVRGGFGSTAHAHGGGS
jgi:hypothetical protein